MSDPDSGAVAAGPAAGCRLLRDWWDALLTRPGSPGAEAVVEGYLREYGEYIKDRAAPPLCDRLERGVKISLGGTQ